MIYFEYVCKCFLQPGDKSSQYTVEDMVTFSKEIIPTSLLKLSNDHASRAVKVFQLILKYMGEAGEAVGIQHTPPPLFCPSKLGAALIGQA